MTRSDQVDLLVAGLAPVRDQDLLDAGRSPQAMRLLETILEEPVRRRRLGRRRRMIAAAAAVVLAVVLVTTALATVGQVRSWLSGGHGPDFPVPAAADVLIASGFAGVPWRIVATPSDQGLCLFLVTRKNGEPSGAGGCGYSDIRGDLPGELRGDPSARCIATPSTAVPCGSLPRHWVDAVSGSGTADARLTSNIVFAAAAEGVERVDLVLADNRTVPARLVTWPHGAPLSVYWAVLPPGQFVTMAIARDASGRMLERRLPAWNGNPTGDPEGPRPPPARRAA